MKRWFDLSVVILTVVAGWLVTTSVQEPLVKKAEFAYEDYQIVPVRVHLLRAPDGHSAGTKLKPEDVERIFRKANGIWHKAGVHLWVETVRDEQADIDAMQKSEKSANPEILLPIRPKASLAPGMFHVYYIGDMPPNGIYIRRDGIFVKENAMLRKVEGGIDEPLPRVTAHELGHGMSLPHRQDNTNLLASGTTGTSLNDAEIEKVRQTISTFTWVKSVSEFLKETEKLKEGKPDVAVSRWKTAIDIPGKSTLKDAATASLKTLRHKP